MLSHFSELRRCKVNLENDLQDKCTSYDLDSRCAGLHNGSLGMTLHNDSVRIDPRLFCCVDVVC